MTDFCAAGDRCVYFDRQRDSPVEIESGWLCEGCLSAGERSVSALPFDYVSLEQLLKPSLGVWGDGQPSAGDEHPTPLNVPAVDLQIEIWRVVTTWEEIVRDKDKLSASITKGVRNGWAVDQAEKILRPRIRLLAAIPATLLAGYPAGEDDEVRRFGWLELVELPGWRGVLDFGRLHRRAQSLLGLTSPLPERCHGVTCRGCDYVNVLYREPGSDRVICGNCRLEYDADDYGRWVGILGAAARREVA